MEEDDFYEKQNRIFQRRCSAIWISIIVVACMSFVRESNLNLQTLYGSASWFSLPDMTVRANAVDYDYDTHRRDEERGWEVDDKDSFSACLLVMDENARLPEWLAYNYYAMPLRYLVVANDINSDTSPDLILDRWRDRMQIQLWSDVNFTKRNLSRRETAAEEEQGALNFKHYLLRQQLFYTACLRHMKQQNRSWVAISDVDEYLAPNSDVLGLSISDTIIREPGFVMNMVRQLQADTFPRDENASFWHEHFNKSSCIVLPRDRYGSYISNTSDVAQDVPSFLNTSAFDTLRFRYRTLPRMIRGAPALVKSMVDVSRLSAWDIRSPANPHRPARTCGKRYMNYGALPLGFHHYIGSWENYARKNDARGRRYETWYETASRNEGGPCDEVRPWIGEFVKLVGKRDAMRLLEGTG